MHMFNIYIRAKYNKSANLEYHPKKEKKQKT